MSGYAARHWVHTSCPLCGWSKTFSPESKPAAIRKTCREIAEHFVAHRLAATRSTDGAETPNE